MPSEHPQKNSFKTFYAISFAWQLGFLIIFPIAGFIALGLWLDAIFQTPPFLLLLGVIAGLTITGYEVYHSLIPLIKNRHHRENG